MSEQLDNLKRLHEIADEMAKRVTNGPGSKASDYLEGWAAAEIERLRSVLTQFVAVCDTAPPTSLMIEIGMACHAARKALAGELGK